MSLCLVFFTLNYLEHGFSSENIVCFHTQRTKTLCVLFRFCDCERGIFLDIHVKTIQGAIELEQTTQMSASITMQTLFPFLLVYTSSGISVVEVSFLKN